MLTSMKEYLLRETAVAIEHMAKSDAPLHMFNYGKNHLGQEFVFVLAVMPKEMADAIERGFTAATGVPFKPLGERPESPDAEPNGGVAKPC
jgi:hypothetical protein